MAVYSYYKYINSKKLYKPRKIRNVYYYGQRKFGGNISLFGDHIIIIKA